MYDTLKQESKQPITELSFDQWIDTPEGWAWLDDMADATANSRAAELYGTRPALGATWEGF